MPTQPLDSFDRATYDFDRRGAHRGPTPPGRGFVAFAWAALATGILVGLGVLGLLVVNNGLPTSNASFGVSAGAGAATDAASGAASSAPAPTVEPTIDPKLSVTILNGTATEGLATRAGDQITAAGWTVGALANASVDTVTTSTVYYASAANEGAAKGLAASLGGLPIAISDQFAGSDLTAVLGTDYVDPGTTTAG